MKLISKQKLIHCISIFITGVKLFDNNKTHKPIMQQFCKLTKKISDLHPKLLNQEWLDFYHQNHSIISSFVRILKKKELSNSQIVSIKFPQLIPLAQFLINFIGTKQSYRSQLFLESLAALDSILSSSPTVFEEMQFAPQFCFNIRKYFCKLCEQQQDPQNSSTEIVLKFQFYTVFYIIVLLIYQSGKSIKNQLKKIPIQILNKTFIGNLLSLDIPKKSKLRKLVSIILLYLVKKTNLKLWGKKIIQYILKQLGFADNRKTVFNFVFALRQLNNQIGIQIQSLKKYETINILKIIWIKHYEDYQGVYILDFVEELLKKDQLLSKQFADDMVINMLGFPLFSKDMHPLFPQVSMRILLICFLYVNKDFYKANFVLNLQFWTQNQLSIRYIRNFFEILNEQQLVVLIKSKYFKELKQILMHNNEYFRNQGVEIVKKMLLKSWKISPNLMNSLFLSLQDFMLYSTHNCNQTRLETLSKIEYFYERRFYQYSEFSLN